MKPSNEGSKEFDIVVNFLSYKKEKERGLTVETAGEKENIFEDSMVIKAENSKILENGNLETEKGNILVKFADYKKVKENNEGRVTDFALEKKKRQKQKANNEIAL